MTPVLQIRVPWCFGIFNFKPMTINQLEKYPFSRRPCTNNCLRTCEAAGRMFAWKAIIRLTNLDQLRLSCILRAFVRVLVYPWVCICVCGFLLCLSVSGSRVVGGVQFSDWGRDEMAVRSLCCGLEAQLARSRLVFPMSCCALDRGQFLTFSTDYTVLKIERWLPYLRQWDSAD